MELLLGAGSRHEKQIWLGQNKEWSKLVTLDMMPDHKPDVVWDITQRPLPFEENTFSEIHAYDVLEHLSQQGDYRSFFDEWSEWWRLLKPGGFVFAISPHWSSPWAWGDPGHTRVYSPEVLTFLDQAEYTRQIGVTPMTDYRSVYKADFEPVHIDVTPGGPMKYVLKAHKPARIDDSYAS